MIHTLRQFARMLKISAILSRYRLDEFLEATHLYRPMRLLRLFARRPRQAAGQPRIQVRILLQADTCRCAPHQDRRHVQIGHAEAIGGQEVAPRQRLPRTMVGLTLILVIWVATSTWVICVVGSKGSSLPPQRMVTRLPSRSEVHSVWADLPTR